MFATAQMQRTYFFSGVAGVAGVAGAFFVSTFFAGAFFTAVTFFFVAFFGAAFTVPNAKERVSNATPTNCVNFFM